MNEVQSTSTYRDEKEIVQVRDLPPSKNIRR
jgi:hypothetical protein